MLQPGRASYSPSLQPSTPYWLQAGARQQFHHIMIEWVTACQDGSWDSGVDCQPPSGEVTFQFTVVTEVLQHFASAPCLSGHSQGDSGQTRGGQEVLMQENIGAGWSGSNLHGGNSIPDT